MSQQPQVYDEIQIQDLDFDLDTAIFTYPCPCGDRFVITLQQIKLGQQIAKCPSCSLTIRVVYDQQTYKEYQKIIQQAKV